MSRGVCTYTVYLEIARLFLIHLTSAIEALFERGVSNYVGELSENYRGPSPAMSSWKDGLDPASKAHRREPARTTANLPVPPIYVYRSTRVDNTHFFRPGGSRT